MTNPRERFRLISLPADKRRTAFRDAVAAGLAASPKYLPCCYFYDRKGSELFESICELPEYYLTRAETAILKASADEIAGLFPREVTLVEFGSGNAAKTRLLMECFLQGRSRLRYVPIDICRTVLEESSLDLLRSYPRLEVVAVAAEYQEGLRYLYAEAGASRLVLWLGSNIGNFERQEAAAFMRRAGETFSPTDRLLVGIDLRKEPAILQRAYDDSAGVTAQFNLNILVRINRELGGHFDLERFQHRAVYEERMGRIEMYVVSARAQTVAIERLDRTVHFRADEAIHTENSYKYSLDEITELAAAADLAIERQWFDAEQRFSLTLLSRR